MIRKDKAYILGPFECFNDDYASGIMEVL